MAYFCRVKKGLAFILLCVFSFQAFYSSALTVWFYANQTEIAKAFCINKARPEMKCNGNCYLSKKLKESDSSTKEQPSPIKQLVEISLCVVSNLNYNFNIEAFSEIVNPYYFNVYSFKHEVSIFHPPLLS